MTWQLILLAALFAAIAMVYFVIAPWWLNRDIPQFAPHAHRDRPLPKEVPADGVAPFCDLLYPCGCAFTLTRDEHRNVAVWQYGLCNPHEAIYQRFKTHQRDPSVSSP